RSLFPEAEAKKWGVELIYVNTSGVEDVPALLNEIVGGTGYDDVFVYAPVTKLIEDADKILGKDGCMNFFAGPTDTTFSAKVNFYNIHYTPTHIMGSTGGNDDDMKESLAMSSKGLINPAVMITHVGGLDSACEAILNLPKIPGGKKLIYNEVNMPLTALEDFRAMGSSNPLYLGLADILDGHKGLWSAEAERYLLNNFIK
ncbi:MAG: zinc-binding dehydrogenase, partial [Vallitaleaceae bacterium]|nr:zinc-binding dehydrogenase [Vallitaleaceae bacterium]